MYYYTVHFNTNDQNSGAVRFIRMLICCPKGKMQKKRTFEIDKKKNKPLD